MAGVTEEAWHTCMVNRTRQRSQKYEFVTFQCSETLSKKTVLRSQLCVQHVSKACVSFIGVSVYFCTDQTWTFMVRSQSSGWGNEKKSKAVAHSRSLMAFASKIYHNFCTAKSETSWSSRHWDKVTAKRRIWGLALTKQARESPETPTHTYTLSFGTVGSWYYISAAPVSDSAGKHVTLFLVSQKNGRTKAFVTITTSQPCVTFALCLFVFLFVFPKNLIKLTALWYWVLWWAGSQNVQKTSRHLEHKGQRHRG